MGYDGWVTVGTKLDTKQLEKDLKDAERKLKTFEKEGEKLTTTKAKIEIELQGYEKQKQLIKEATNETLKLAQTEEQVSNVLDTEKIELNNLNEQYSKQFKTLDDINKKIIQNAKNQELVKNQIEDTNRKLTQARGIDDIKEAMNSVAKATSNSIKQVGRWALAVFGLRSAYMLVRNAASSLSQYNEQIKVDLEYIRFALASALQPLVEGMIQLTYKLLQYINYIAQAWFGVNLFANASADAMDRTATSAKEFRKALAGFDEMNLVSGGASNASAGGTVLPSVNLQKPEEGEIPEWLQWIADNGEFVRAALVGIATALTLIKLGIDGILATGIGIIVMGIIGLVEKVKIALEDLDAGLENNGTSWKQIGDILLYISLVIAGVAAAIVSLPLAITAAVVGILATLMAFWNEVKFGFDWLIDWLMQKANLLSSHGEVLISTILVVIGGAIATVRDFFDGLFISVKDIVDGILFLFKGDFKEGFISIGKGIANAFITIMNTVIAAINSVWTGMLNIIDTAGSWFGQKWDLSKDLAIPKIPYLAVGGIINMPGRGVPVGGAFGGEAGAEGVIPLTDSQAMERLGETIGKYITINANITNTMNGRVISRELQRLTSEDDFAFNS